MRLTDDAARREAPLGYCYAARLSMPWWKST